MVVPLGLGAVLVLVFASMSLRMASWAGAVLVVVVLGLDWAVRRVTGVSFERFTATPGAGRLYGAYLVAFVLLAAAGMALEWAAGVRFVIAGAGLVIGALTVAVGYRVDAAVRGDLRAGR